MDDNWQTPSQAMVEIGAAPRSPASHSMPSALPTPKSMAGGRIWAAVSKLALRHPPSEKEAIEDYQARLKLLASDVAHLPAGYVERACQDLATEKPFMPKAADIAAKCRDYLANENRTPTESDKRAWLHELAARYNANLGERAGEKEWYVTANDELKIRTTKAALEKLEADSAKRRAWNSDDERRHTRAA